MKIRNIPVYARIIVMLMAYIWSVQPGPVSIKVRNAAQALSEALGYLRKKNVQGIPGSNIEWQEQTLYSPGPQDFIVTSKLYRSNNWNVEVSQGMAPLSRTVYQVTMFNAELLVYWQGRVRADGNVTEVSAYRILSEEESTDITEGFTQKSQVPAPKPGGYGH